jgi:hypothetical protein
MSSVTEDQTTVPLSPQVRDALRACAEALDHRSAFELDAPLNRRMRDLGERKDSLAKEEYEELLSLIALSEQRTREKLEAELALRQLREVVPEFIGS